MLPHTPISSEADSRQLSTMSPTCDPLPMCDKILCLGEEVHAVDPDLDVREGQTEMLMRGDD